MGHSNGGFLSYRFACEHPELISGIVSLAGVTWKDNNKCKKTGHPLNILHIHSTADTTILYNGGDYFEAYYPSVDDTISTWQSNLGCTSDALVATGTTLDNVVAANVSGDETTVYKTASGSCPDNASITFWKMVGPLHTPVVSATFP
jgi:polyhydroxybutyrate depolymerase